MPKMSIVGGIQPPLDVLAEYFSIRLEGYDIELWIEEIDGYIRLALFKNQEDNAPKIIKLAKVKMTT